jgi:hypothetical protein
MRTVLQYGFNSVVNVSQSQGEKKRIYGICKFCG